MSTTLERSDGDLRRQAIARLRERREFWLHVLAFLVVNGTLVVIWAVSTRDAMFWPAFLMAAWGIGLVFHGAEVFRRPFTEARIQREMRRMGTGPQEPEPSEHLPEWTGR